MDPNVQYIACQQPFSKPSSIGGLCAQGIEKGDVVPCRPLPDMSSAPGSGKVGGLSPHQLGSSAPGLAGGSASGSASPQAGVGGHSMETDNLGSMSQTRRLSAAYFYHEHERPSVEVNYRIRLLYGNANKKLAEDVAKCLKLELTKCEVKNFANGETSIKINENVRGDDCFIIQPTTGNDTIDLNTAMMELLLMIHTLRMSSAKRITAVVPYFGYSRQDRKTQSRVPISASAIAQLIQSMGVDRVMTVDLHCGQIQGFFRNMPMDNLLMYPEFADYIVKQKWFDPAKTAIVSPDAGGVERAKVLADRINANAIVTILKRRVEAGKVESMVTVGNVKDMVCIIVDDMVDTAGTLVKACNLLKELGATKVIACATHGILTSPAIERINDCEALSSLIVSDSIPQVSTQACKKLVALSVAPMIADAISRIHTEKSLSEMFASQKQRAEL
jgi:ribose-phosphate pyrophosphokinase